MNETAYSDKTNTRSNGLILIAALLVFGFVFGGVGLYRYNIGRASAGWPSVKGKITYSRPSPHKKKNGHEYMPTVSYNYTVKGKRYAGSRITASDEYAKTLGSAQDVLSQYPVGVAVTVYYDPADPAKSLLETGIRKNTFVMLGGGMVCFCLAIAITVSMFRQRSAG